MRRLMSRADGEAHKEKEKVGPQVSLAAEVVAAGGNVRRYA